MNIKEIIDINFRGNVYIVQDDNVLCESVTGCADLANEVPNSLDTRFASASAGKVFVAVGILQLIEQGKIKFQDTLGKLLPIDLHSIDPDVTVEQLLNHTSGVPDYFDEMVMDEYEELWIDYPNYKIRRNSDLLPLFIDKPMMYSKGEKFKYRINNQGDIIETIFVEGDTAAVKEKYAELSASNYLFFFGEQDITKFINGRAVDEKNIFYSRSDRMKYREKKDISKINEVMDDYSRQYITQQANYMLFFADNSTLRQVSPDLVNRNILRNKPEHYMRDHLCNYLSEHMKYTFLIEPELGQSKRELDIYFDVSGELYFIEIKWLGVSINDDGTGLTQPYTDARARSGVTQTLEYIEELMNTSEKSLRHGYLAIFDARDNKTNIDFQGYSFVREELQSYMPFFSVLKVIPLNKRHSA